MTDYDKVKIKKHAVRAPDGSELFRLLVENARDYAIFTTDVEDRVTSWNTGAERFFGHTEEEMLGQNAELLFTPEDRERGVPEQELCKAAATGRAEDERWHLRKDGTRFWASGIVEPLRDDSKTLLGFVKIGRDLAGRKRAERRLIVEHTITRTLSESATLEEATPQILQAICETLHWDLGSLWSADAGVLRCVEMWRDPSAKAEEFVDLCRNTTFARGVGLPGSVWQTGAPLWVADITESEVPRKHAASRDGLHGAVGFPILLGNEILGVLEFFSREIREPDQEVLSMMSAIGSQIGQFIERRHAEEALRESESKYRMLMEQASDGIHTYDMRGNFIETNSKLCEMLGYTREELMRLNVRDLVPAEDLAVDPICFDELRGGKTLVRERRLRRKDETLLHVEISGRMVQDGVLQAIIRDVTERRRADRAVKFQAHLLDTVEQAVIATDLAGNVTYWNRFAEKLYGWTAAEAGGSNVLDLIPAPATQEQASEIMSYLSKGRSWSGEFLVRHKDDTPFPIIVTNSPIYDEEGELVGIVGISFDITERKRAEESLRKAHDELERRVEERTVELANANAMLTQEIAERQRAEQTLRENHNLLQWVIEGTTDCIFVKDLDGRYLMINSAAANFVGKPAEEILGKNDMELFPPETARKLIEYDRQVMATGETRASEETLPSKGELRTVSEVKSVYRNDEGEAIGLIGIARDITERKRMEEALRESEERYKGLADTAFNGVVIHQDGIIKEVNWAYAEMYGYTPEELKGRNILVVTPPQQRELVLSYMTNAVETPYEVLGLKKDGTFINIEVSAKNCFYEGRPARLAAVRDVTERRRAEEELMVREESYRKLIELSPDTILVHSEGKVDYINQAGMRFFGAASPEQIIGLPVLDLIHPGFRELVRERIRQNHAGRKSELIEEKLVRLDGQVVSAEVTGIGITYQGKQATQVIIRDITERVRAREARIQLQLRLLAAQEEERHRISRELHDQMGQHLPALMLGLKALKDRDQSESWAVERLQRLQDLAELIAQDAHTLARELRPVALDGLGLHTALSNYVEEWSAYYSITVDFHSTGFDEDERLPPHVEITLYRTVQEALTNVVKHAQAKHVSLILERSREAVVAVVEDDGKGFDMDAVRDTPISERRLGLLGMQERVELVSGTLEIESVPGAGTTVAVRIPTSGR